jgi:endonuclease/exonuclease/phosphatase family metal-dependent hydrolase
VSDVLHALDLSDIPRTVSSQSIQQHRAVLLGGKLRKVFGRATSENESIIVTGLGPVCHCYFPADIDSSTRDRIAKGLVDTGSIPLVMCAEGEGSGLAWSREGCFKLPEQAEEVLGTGHRFLGEVRNDLVTLLHHPFSGNLVLSGWRKEGQPISFPVENGAHAGPGYEETHGFALIPRGAPFDRNGAGYIRACDIREAALRLRGKTRTHHVRHRYRAAQQRVLRVMTYNTHGCLGMDGRVVPERVARIIARYDPDIVALQEIDVGRGRSGGIDQAQQIAHALDMEYHFHPSYLLEEGQYGVAMLCHEPVRLKKTGVLPGVDGQEPRGALCAEVSVENRMVQVIITHLSLHPAERLLQAKALLGPEWLDGSASDGPVIICGDLNTVEGWPAHRELSARFQDAHRGCSRRPESRSWMGVATLDYVFVSRDFHVCNVAIPRTQLTRVASDHLPVVADLILEGSRQ